MKKILFLLIWVVLVNADAFSIKELKTEFSKNPVGLQTAAPRFSWQMGDVRRGAVQSGYHILAASSPECLLQEKGDLWDSGFVVSKQSHLIPYKGKTLKSRQIVWWTVCVRNDAGEISEWAEPACFETGLLFPVDWEAKWIMADLLPVNNAVTETWLRHLLREDWTEAHRGNIPELYRALKPAPRFRRTFEMNDGIISARLYISGMGHYTAWLNGKRIGDRVMAPAQTDYDRRIFYDIYDVAEMLQSGKNAIGIELADGWYHQLVPKIGFEAYGEPVLRAQLEIITSSGRQIIATGDGQWKTAAGPLLKNDLHTGEAYDARLEQPGWNTAGFDERNWTDARLLKILLPDSLNPSGKEPEMVAQMLEPERRICTLSPVLLTHPKKEVWVFHFPVRISGRLQLTVSDIPEGTPLILRVGETLRGKENIPADNRAIFWYDQLEGTKVENGRRTGDLTGLPNTPQAAHVQTRPDEQKNIFQAHITPTSVYVTKGGECEVWENEYSHQSFQYVELIGFPEGRTPDLETIKAIVVNTDAPEIGTFRSSDSYLNSYEEMFRRTFYSCLHGTLGDNPASERTGWFGDNVTGLDGVYYHTDLAKFLQKWNGDIRSTMEIRGRMWQTAPGKRSDGPLTPPAWAVGNIILPWHLWIYYGDNRILQEHYPLMVQCVDYYAERLDKNSIWRGFGYGDWGDVNTEMIGKDGGTYPRKGNFPLNTPTFFTDTAALYDGAVKLTVIAEHLGKSKDAERYRKLSAAIQTGLNSPEFYNAAEKTYGSQSANAVAILFGFAPSNCVPDLLDWIHHDIDRQNGHFTTGSYTLPYFFKVLSDYGRIDDAFRTMTSPGYPGFRHMVDLGSTTVWSMWDGNTRSPDKHCVQRSNQHAYSDSGSLWLYYGLAGIKPDISSPGWQNFILQPGVPDGLDSVAAETETPYGRVVSRWSRSDGRFHWEINIPPNSTATVHVPLLFGQDSVVYDYSDLVLQNGKAVQLVAGISFQEIRGNTAVFKVSSGQYQWIIREVAAE